MKVKVEIDEDVADQLVVEMLKAALDSLICDIESREDGQIPYGIFHNNIEKDLKRLRKMAKSFKKVLEWYE